MIRVKKIKARGKSSREKTAMIAELRADVRNQSKRADSWKARWKETKQELIKTSKRLLFALNRIQKHRNDKDNLKDKVKRRDLKEESLEQEIKELELTIKQKERELVQLEREKDKKGEKIKEISLRKRKVIVKKVPAPIPAEVKKLQRIAEKGLTERLAGNLEYIIRTANFLKEQNVSLDHFSILTQTELIGNVKSSDVNVNYRVLNKLTELGYLNSSQGLKGASKYWYLSLKGKKLMEDYRILLSWGKSAI